MHTCPHPAELSFQVQGAEAKNLQCSMSGTKETRHQIANSVLLDRWDSAQNGTQIFTEGKNIIFFQKTYVGNVFL